MNRVNRLQVVALVHQASDRTEHAVHRFAEILPAMGGDEDKTAPLGPFQMLVLIVIPNRRGKGINAGIARHEDALRIPTFFQQVLTGLLRGSEVQVRYQVDRLAAELLWEGGLQVVGAQPRLHMADRDLKIEAGKRRGKTGCGIAVHQHNIGPEVLQNLLHAEQHQ